MRIIIFTVIEKCTYELLTNDFPHDLLSYNYKIQSSELLLTHLFKV